MAFVVVAKWTAREGEADKVEEAIKKLTPLSREERATCFIRLTATRRTRTCSSFTSNTSMRMATRRTATRALPEVWLRHGDTAPREP